MRARSNHIQIINFNEWPISYARLPPHTTQHCSPHSHTTPFGHTPPKATTTSFRTAVCKQCAMLAPLLRSCSLSATLVGCECSAGDHAYSLAAQTVGCVCVCVWVSQRALLAQHCWQRRWRRRRMHIHKRASSRQHAASAPALCL